LTEEDAKKIIEKLHLIEDLFPVLPQ
jgi:hypothetical protein